MTDKLFIQIDDEVREMTEDEKKSYLKDIAAIEAKEAEAKAKVEARESALAKLAKLGLTEEEIASL
jgi:DNA-binding NarL/FixJ family response regulator